MRQSRVVAMLGDLASGRDPLSSILAGELAILEGTPLVLGQVIRGLLIAAALAERARRLPLLWRRGK